MAGGGGGAREPPADGPAAGGLRLEVKALVAGAGPATHRVELPAGAGLGALRGALEPLTGVPPARQRLLFMGRAVQGDADWEAAPVRDGSVLHMVETPEGAGPAPGAGGPPPGPPQPPVGGMPQLPIVHLGAQEEGLRGGLLQGGGGGGGGRRRLLPLAKIAAYTRHVQRGLDSSPQEGEEAPAGPSHRGSQSPFDLRHYEVKCDGCDQNPIRGTLYRSLSHRDYNLCEACWQRETSAAPGGTSHGPFARLTLPLPLRQPVNEAQWSAPGALMGLRRDLEAVCPASAPTSEPGGAQAPSLARLAIRGVGQLATEAIRTASRAAARAQAHAEELSEVSQDGQRPVLEKAEAESLQSSALHLAAYLHSAATLLAESSRLAAALTISPGSLATSPLLLAMDGYVHDDSWSPRLRPPQTMNTAVVPVPPGGLPGLGNLPPGGLQALLNQAMAGGGTGLPGLPGMAFPPGGPPPGGMGPGGMGPG